MKINIGVCDDNEKILNELYSLIQNCNWKNNNISIDKFTSGKELLSNIKNGTKYDVIFMDVQLNDNYLGTDTGIIVKMIIPSTLLIYISSYDSFYENIALAEPFKFLNKPIDKNKLDNVVNAILNRLHFLNDSFLYKFKSNGMINIVNLNEVAYFESQHHVIIIHEKNGTTLRFYHKLDEVENEVCEIYPYFVRINKSYLVNFQFIKIIHPNSVVLSDDITALNVSPKYKANLFEIIRKFGHDLA